jgi:23S rRNA pseudouridine1911/1915/1917 synthase
MRLDLALIRRHPELSRRKARAAIEKGQVDVDGEAVVEPGREVAPSAAIRWDVNRKARSRARASLPVLYRDDWLVIVDKPAGLLSVPTTPESEEDTVLRRVQEFARHLRPGRPYAAAVHRLDRDTSGALAFALTPKARAPLRDLFRAHRIERRYLALVEGAPRGDRGEVEAPLFEGYEGGRRRVARAGEPGREALTRFSVRERFPGAALLEVELGTGRQHQIRVHLAHVGLPVLGDEVYGPAPAARHVVSAPRQMLHAWRLAFRHPGTGAAVAVESAPPDDFVRVLDVLRRRPRASGSAALSGGRRGPGERPGTRRRRP